MSFALRQARYQPYWWESTAVRSDEVVVHISWKAYVFRDDQVFFDLQPVLGQLVERRGQDLRVGWEMRRYRASLEGLFQVFGWFVHDELPPSGRQVRQGRLEVHEKSCEAMIISFRGLLAMLAHDVNFKSHGEHRFRAEAVLRNLLSRLLSACFDVVNLVAPLAADGAVCGLCLDDVAGGRCSHLRKMCSRLPQAPAAGPGPAATVLIAVLSLAFECPTVAAVAAQFYDAVAAKLGQDLQTRGFQTDAYKACNPGNSNKRKNFDDDYKREMTGPLCKRDNVGTKQRRNWMVDELRSLQLATWRTFKNFRRGVVNVAEDGARVGNPAEELIVYYANVPRVDVASWLPPQVC